MTVSIIIPTLNEVAHIELAIERAWQAGADQVIVSDGGSGDGTVALAQKQNCDVVTGPPGRGQQLNAGANLASNEFLLFLHADNWLAQGVCQQIRQRATEKAFQFGGYQQRIDNPNRIYRWLEMGNAWRVRVRGLVYGDQAFFIRRKLFEQIGGFPEIPIMEDLEICRRLKRYGRPALLVGPTIVGDRRWVQTGPVRQTVKNWYLSTAFLLGASPQWLQRKYKRHDLDQKP